MGYSASWPAEFIDLLCDCRYPLDVLNNLFQVTVDCVRRNGVTLFRSIVQVATAMNHVTAALPRRSSENSTVKPVRRNIKKFSVEADGPIYII
jgi:hypothetical protein